MVDVLLIDDDGELAHSLARAISPRLSPLTLGAVTSVAKAFEAVRADRPRVIVLDLCLEERRGVESGFEFLSWCRSFDATVRIVVLTGHGSLAHGIRALTLGASSFIEKPVDPEHLAAVLIDASSQAILRRELDRISREGVTASYTQLIGRSKRMADLREAVVFASSIPQPVLLLGETGTGKGLCARLIHESSPRRDSKFIHYQPNFGGGDLSQSELFGHRKGAFTGATEARNGLAVEADKGTLFIDELDEVPSEVQVKLLDLVQEQRVRAIGSDSFRSVDCRIIAATNRRLEEALSNGCIRRDLYHRLAYNVIHLPPLRDRIDDIPDLCHGVLRSLRAREVVQVFDIAPEVEGRLRAYRWPGNVRELCAVVENGAYHAHYRGRTVICAEDIPSIGSSHTSNGLRSFHEQVEGFKMHLVSDALQQCNGNQVHAAQLLGLDRGTLRRIVARVAKE